MMDPTSERTSEASWISLVQGLGAGKAVGGSVYVHVSALPPSAMETIARAAAIAECPDEAFNVVRFGVSRREVSLLSYPSFFVEAFPTLTQSWTVDLDRAICDCRRYPHDSNPPVLHRKERLLHPDDPLRPMFAATTANAERHGLFDDPAIIGHRVQWEEELRSRGLRVVGNILVERTATDDAEPPIVARHKTALVRRSLSTPMQALWRHGFLDGRRTVFDYGCGRGDDVAALRARSIEASGWDPYFRPDAARVEADVVNLGFVLNVIEHLDERRHALQSAFALAREVLTVAALIGGRTALESQRLYRDGVFTRIGTFQKYFTHAELGAYIAEVVGHEAISVGPGIYFVFRTDDAEGEFLEARQRSRPTLAVPAPPERPPAPRRAPQRREQMTLVRASSKWEANAELLGELWRAVLILGRAPADESEFARLAELKCVASVGHAVAHLSAAHGATEIERARTRRERDLLVLFALNLFERRRSFSNLSPRVQRDVREFWGSHQVALEHARALLFSVSDSEALENASRAAAEADLGYLVPGDAFFFDSALANDLPEVLRVYVGCAGRLHGEVARADLVKVHLASGKLTVMTYDDFDCAAIPMLVERVKIDLRRQSVQSFEYGRDYAPQPLYLKSRHMDPRRPLFTAQRMFDAQLLEISDLDWSGYGPPLEGVLPYCRHLVLPEGLSLPSGLKPPPRAFEG